MASATPDPSTEVVTRFAPSPTGFLHVGGARTALFNWLLARRHGGRYLLRIEDTDLARSTEEATRQLLEDLRWLGLHWDNAELVYQSKRLDLYNRIIDGMIARGQAYKAYDTPEELDALRKQAEKQKRQFRYTRPHLTDEQTRRYEAVAGRTSCGSRCRSNSTASTTPCSARGRESAPARCRTSSSARATACRRTTSPSSLTTLR